MLMEIVISITPDSKTLNFCIHSLDWFIPEYLCVWLPIQTILMEISGILIISGYVNILLLTPQKRIECYKYFSYVENVKYVYRHI